MLPVCLRFLGPRRQVYLTGLLDHYRPVAWGMSLLREALDHAVAKRPDTGFKVLAGEIDTLEAEADKVKRHIRNHLPVAWLMVVDKTLFLDYTRHQDNILDAVQEAATWLALAPFDVTPELAAAISTAVATASETVTLLHTALSAVVEHILKRQGDRDVVKSAIQAIRGQHLRVVQAKRALIGAAYASDMDFGRVYQVIRFVEYVSRASHNAEGCADILRAMLAR
jgi:predicted phosphate transport protein (TIGR00153 family)